MVSDVRLMHRQSCALELRRRSRPPTCTFRDDVRRVAKELLEARSSDLSVDTSPHPNQIHLLIADTLSRWSLASSFRDTTFPTRKSNCLSQTNGENTSANSEADVLDAEANSCSRRKRKSPRNESLEKLSVPRRVGRQALSCTDFSWKACIDEQSYCYRPENLEYLQWKISARLQLQERLEKHSANGKVGYRKIESDRVAISQSDATVQITEQMVKAETLVDEENLPEVSIFNCRSSEGPRLRLGETHAFDGSKDEARFSPNGRGLMIGEPRVSAVKRHAGLPEKRTIFPSISSRPRFSHLSFSTLQRRLELPTLSVEGVQIAETQRRCSGSGEEAEDGKQTLDWFIEEGDGEEEEEAGLGESDSEQEDVFELNDSNVEFDRNACKSRRDYRRNECRRIDEEKGKSSPVDSELDQIPSTECNEDDGTDSCLSRQPDEEHGLSQIYSDHLRFRDLDADFEDQMREELTGVLTISRILPPTGTENFSMSCSEDTSGSELQDAQDLEAKLSEGTCEDLGTASEGSSDPIELKLDAETLRLDFRRSSIADRPRRGRLLRLRNVRATNLRRSTSSSDPSRNVVEIACAKVIGITVGGQSDHVTQHGDVIVEMTSSFGADDGVIVTSLSDALQKCKVIEWSSQPNGCGVSNGFRAHPIGAPQRTRTRAADTSNQDLEAGLPLLTGTKLQRM